MNASPTRKRQLGRVSIAALALFALADTSLKAAEDNPSPEIDPVTGMIIDDDWMTVMAMCSACHSPKLFTNYGGTRETWASLIVWMQKTQGLWPLDPVTEDKILTYLAKNYPPGEASRRRNIPVSMRPPNPYISAARAEFEAKREKGEIEKPKANGE